MKTLLALLPLAALAQEMTGPTLGWSIREDGRLQAIHGVAGAARLGSATGWPEAITAVTLSPGGQRAVALEAGLPVLIDLATQRRTPLPGALRADVKIWSPLGTALLLANRETGQVQTYRLEGAGFELREEFTLAAQRYAISDDGASVLALAGDEFLLRGVEGARVLSSRPGGFTFLARTNTPVYTEGEDLVLGAQRIGLAFAAGDLESPAAGRLLAVDRAGGKVRWLDEQGATLAEASCGCVIDRLERLGTEGTLRLVTAGEGPAWFTETTAAGQRLFFVPPSDVASEVQ